METGGKVGTSDFSEATRAAFDLEAKRGSADIRERLGGLGQRFSTDTINTERRFQEDLSTRFLADLTGREFDASQAAESRRLGFTDRILGLPFQLQDLLSREQDERGRDLDRLENVITQNPPVGGSTRGANPLDFSGLQIGANKPATSTTPTGSGTGSAPSREMFGRPR